MGFAVERNGEIDDRVRVELGEHDVRIFEEYSVHTAILQQPAAFVVRLSAGKRQTRELLELYPPGTRFALSIGPQRQFTGEIDGPEVSGDEGSTSVQFKGRDLLARLNDGDIDAERSFQGLSLMSLVKIGLGEVGIGAAPVSTSNDSNILARTGARVKITGPAIKAHEVKRIRTGGGEKLVLTAKIGESWLDFITRQLKKEGLFLWSTATGGFVLSRPNANQEAVYEFVRGRNGRSPNFCNVTRAHFVNDTSRRFSEVVVFARAGGGKFGRNNVHGGFVDKEMVDLGFKRRRVYRDADVTNAKEAAAYAAFKIGEVNRASWRLQYTVSGHTAPVIGGGRSVIVPDTIACVRDDELGINDDLYVESCEYTSPPRTTKITLMRTQDLVFGDFE